MNLSISELKTSAPRVLGDASYDAIIEAANKLFPGAVSVDNDYWTLEITGLLSLHLSFSGRETKITFDLIPTDRGEKTFCVYSADLAIQYLIFKKQELDLIQGIDGC